MNTAFSLADRQFTLIRYPAKHQHKSLQAWDSADELLIEHIEPQLSEHSHQATMAIFNDDFGALGCWFAHLAPAWISDSYISRRSLLENLQLNEIANQLSILSSVDSLSYAPVPPPDYVVIKIPRALALLEQQLIDLKKYVTPQTQVIAAGKVKTVTKSVLSLFETYLGPTTTSLAKKKSRLVFCTPSNTLKDTTSPYPTSWQCKANTGKSLTVSNHANVFSRQSLDIGARIMMPHMAVVNNDNVIDLGCGNGVLGLNALAMAPECNVTFVDESYMAIESAKENVNTNFPDQIDQCQFVASNCLESLLTNLTPYNENNTPYTKVFCNPPFHQQNAITDHIAWQMFSDAKALLNKGGHLVVVGNRHLDYHIKLKRLFGGVKVLASDKKFVILVAAKR